jgi:hypothetical protein
MNSSLCLPGLFPPAPPPPPTIAQTIAAGLASLDKLKGFIGPDQRRTVAHLIRHSEEREWFAETMARLAATVATMPVTYQQDGLGDAAVAHLHYFTAGSDAWITEKDKGAPGDAPEDFQVQAYGFVRHASMPDCAETGYVSIPELLACGAELDFHFPPTTLAAIYERHA